MAEDAVDGAVPDTEFIDANEPENAKQFGIPVNKDPPILNFVLMYVQAYGWFILIAAGVLWYFGSKLKVWYDKCKEDREQNGLKKYDQLTKQQTNMEKQEAARRRLQEQYNEQTADFAEQQKIRDEKKRQERIEDWERHQEGMGYRSKYHPPSESETPSQSNKDKAKKKDKLRQNDYNPLMGDGFSGGRMSRRLGGGGGG